MADTTLPDWQLPQVSIRKRICKACNRCSLKKAKVGQLNRTRI